MSTRRSRRSAEPTRRGTRPAPDPRAAARWRTAGLALLALAAVALAVVAFRWHPIGDYATESDFYAGYARGARALMHGHFDPARYGVYGPLYELALALGGAVGGELFAVARVVAVLSALAVLASAWWLVRRRHGEAAAFWMVALLAVNPTLFVYGYSACGDMLACALWTVSLALLLGIERPAGAAAAGACAALAALTRYNLAIALPAGMLALALARPAGRRLRAIAAFAAAFVVVAAPFVVVATLSGHLPGATLASDAAYYLTDSPAKLLEQRYATMGPGAGGVGAWSTLATLARRFVAGIPDHLWQDAQLLVMKHVAAAALVALVLLLVRRRARALLAPAAYALPVFAALAPVFYSERYSMVLLPLYVLPLAIVLGEGPPGGAPGLALRSVVGAAALAVSLRVSFAYQRLEYASLPREALEAASALRHVARPGERVLARKAHVAYVAGLEPVLFPDVPTLDSLGRFCRAHHVKYLYFSWLEAQFRWKLGYLLDTSAVVPGLAVLHVTADKPGVTYRVGPELGERLPAWWTDSTACARIRARQHELLAPVRSLLIE